MSRGQNPLMLMMALSLPGAAHALGLGEIHVDSALNEPLAAEIDIVGATAEELAGLTATVASRDTFLKFGADRPSFLATATFKVAHDARGRPVLSIRSTDSFTEPLVNLVVDLRWHNGEVIRQYSLLLDPAGFPSAIQQATALTAPAPAAPVTIPRSTLAAPPAAAAPVDTAVASSTDLSAAAKSSRKMTHVKVGAKATLRGVAWRVGARSDVDLNKTMLAIFRANPAAFEGNINILHLGASLSIPSEQVIAAIPADEAKREIRAQMAAWRAIPKSSPNRLAKAPSTPVANTVESQPAAVAATAPATAVNYSVTAPAAPAAAAASATDAELNQRIQTLEQGLHDMQDQVQREHDKLLGVQSQLKYEAKAADSAPIAAAPQPAAAHPSRMPAIFGGLTLLAGALAAIYWKLRRRPAPKAGPKVELTPEPFLDRSADLTPTHSVAAEPMRRDPPNMPQRPIMTEDGMELSAAWNSLRDKQEAKARAQSSAAAATALERSQSVMTVTEEELHAAYDDTLDLSSETAILAAEIAAASGDTAMLAAATVQLSSEALQEAADAALAETSVSETAMMDPSSTNNVATIKLKQAGDSEPTVEHVRVNEADDANAETTLAKAAAMNLDGTKLDYNLTDLDLSNSHHVQMPSMLHEHVVVKERRTNLVDVLKMAIEREPDRSDLRMKLLETYYAAAATNRQGFLDVVQKLARERDNLEEGEWDKIAYMGKQIASDTGLFDSDSGSEADDKLADCA